MKRENDGIIEREDITEDLPLAEQIIAMSVLNCEQLPMLDIIFERFVLSLSSSLRAATSTSVSVELEEVRYTAYGNAMSKLPPSCLIGIASADPWGGNLAVAIDDTFLFAALEVMLGGRPSGRASPHRTSFTNIEQSFGKSLCRSALHELSISFAQVSHVTFSVSRMEVNAQLATIAQPISPSVLAAFRVNFGEEEGRLAIVIPHSTLETIRSSLIQVFFGEKFGGDDNWRNHMRKQVQSSNVDLKAVFNEVKIPLRDVMAWRAGSSIEMFIEPDHEATIHCDGEKIFAGQVGRKRNLALAVKLTKDLCPIEPDDAASKEKETSPDVASD